ncbi:MAG: sugar phosphate isomerase/epimerase family protein [Planctomycetota bacterium]
MSDGRFSKHRNVSRRAILARGCAVAGALAGAPASARGAKRWFKIGACDWSLGKGDPSCFEVAKEIGLDGVQVNLGSERDGLQLRRPEVQRAYLEAAKAAGLEVASLAVAEFNNVNLASEPRAAVWLVDALDVARALGVKVILLAFFSRGEVRPDDEPAMGRLVRLLREVAPRAERLGLALGIENYLSAEDNARILDRVGSPAVQVYYDVGNSTDKGRDILKEIRFLGGKRICEFHAKDGPHLLGKGRIDFRKVREAMDDIGYSGWIQLEAAAPNGIVSDYRTNLAYLREIFPKEV